MSTQNEAANLQASLAALRRDVDALDGKMKEDVQTLRHEYVRLIIVVKFAFTVHRDRMQMEVDNRKNEARADLKGQDITVEVRCPIHTQ